MQPGFAQTCWDGIRLEHPADWEPAVLSGPGEPGKCVLVDRRFQRLQVEWELLERMPDVQVMYRKLGQSAAKDAQISRLKGVSGWTGLVRQEARGWVTHAGRYFPADRRLVRVVITWPEEREAGLERAILEAVAPRGGDPALWEALGLKVLVPAAFELADAHNLVGRTAWEFRRRERPAEGLRIERLAMTQYWLKGPVGPWLAGHMPSGHRTVREGLADCAGHAGAELVTRRGGVVVAVAKRGECRLDRAWFCPTRQRVYWVACWHNRSDEPTFPPGLEVDCCRAVRLVARPS